MSTFDQERHVRAIAAIDAANAADPNRIVVAGVERPKELAHAEMMSAWVARLAPEASEPLLLAARAHHIRRWEVPRASYPEGRHGYLRWRTDLHGFHARVAGELLAREGYDEATIARTGELIHKRGLGRDPEVQVLEDALCLVFLEQELGTFSGHVSHEKLVDILRKTWRKMSPAGQAQALALALPEPERAVVAEALGAG